MLPVLIVQLATAFAWGILDEASIGFLGLGVQPPTPSWGSLLIEGRQYLYDAPWLPIGAGAVVVIGVLASTCSAMDFVTSSTRAGRRGPLMTDPIASEPLIRVEGLTVEFPVRGSVVRAVDAVSFDVGRGEIVGLVGESASGKSTLGLSLLRMVPSPGRVRADRLEFDGRDLLALSESADARDSRERDRAHRARRARDDEPRDDGARANHAGRARPRGRSLPQGAP